MYLKFTKLVLFIYFVLNVNLLNALSGYENLFKDSVTIKNEGDINTYNDFLLSVIPPSPSIGSLQRISDMPEGHYNGRSNLPIELTVVDSDIEAISVEIIYSSNGIMVNEVAGDVGLGWSLNVGGSISRVINQRPDEEDAFGIWDYLSHSDLSGTIEPYYTLNNKGDFYAKIQNYAFAEFSSGVESWNRFLASRFGDNFDLLPKKDMSYDKFSYNFLGFSGSFYIIKDEHNHKVIMQNDDPLTIDCIVVDNDIEGFIIYGPKGNVYRFGFINNAIENINVSKLTDIADPYTYRSAWHLTEVARNGVSDKIVFNFLDDSMHETREIRNYSKVYSGYPPISHQTTPALPNITKMIYDVKKLQSIEWNDKYIDFYYVQDREDMYENNTYGITGVRLDKIEIGRIVNSVKIKKRKIDFYNKDFKVSTIVSHPAFETYQTKRMFLDSLSICGYDYSGDETTISYRFDYYYPENLPPTNSFSTDYWGFNNGEQNSAGPISAETINFVVFGNHNANRNPNPNRAFFGLLKNVKYPTGGSINFTYEGNEYYIGNGLKKPAGGLRIAKIEYLDITSNTEKIKVFEYLNEANNSSGVLGINNFPIFYNASYFYHPGTQFKCWGIDTWDVRAGYSFSNSPVNEMLWHGGNTVGYESITVRTVDIADNDIGKEVYHYYPAYNSLNPHSIGGGDLSENVIFNKVQNSAQKVSNLNEGKLHKYQMFRYSPDGDYQKVIEKELIYGEDYTERLFLPNLTGESLWSAKTICEPVYSLLIYQLIDVNRYSVIKKQTKTEYKYQGSILIDFIKTNSDYYYNASNPFKPQLVFSYALPDSTKQQNWVYMDYLSGVNDFDHVPESLQPVYPDLVSRKRTGKIIFNGSDTQIYMQNGTGVFYNNNFGINKITSERSEVISDFDIQLPEYSEVEYLYDDTYNPLKVIQEDIMHGSSLDEIHEHIAYIWGYNYTLPIAKIENINYTQIVNELSNMGYSIESLQNKSDSELIAIFNSLRNHVNDGLITSFTHIPMLGISSITDPRGLTTKYEYDGFGRLKRVIDHEGKILQEHKYNYADQ